MGFLKQRLSSAKQLWREATKGCTPAIYTITTVTWMRAWLCASRSQTIVSVPLTLLCYFHPYPPYPSLPIFTLFTSVRRSDCLSQCIRSPIKSRILGR